jgi:phage baseplate assembly protein W
MECYRLPFSMVDLLAKKQLKTCDVRRSIAQNLHLILTTQYGEYSFDKHFGCALWDLEFENLTINQSFKEALTFFLKECIEKYETRLTNIHIALDFKIEELPPREGRFERRRIKRKLDIKISGDLIQTNENFNFSHKLYLSPFSYN